MTPFALKTTERVRLDQYAQVLRIRRQAILEAVRVYNETAATVIEFVEERASDFRDAFERRGEGWQRSPQGERTDQFIDEYEAIDFEAVTVEIPELAEDIAALPTEVTDDSA